ncbi:glycosyltransferase family 4 protein [Litoribacter ruber]|uniref:glycosyltransferase family 4 protein n=1 Tax=Litoribacter ruber TaxID=702568 RepID=UPI001BD9FD0A|nr:glycosyltransferase family 4 protein [Litoribacter ruber]MBT0812295.1 glycosyltransferase family 4 protein [Litoribacter ruber]
MKILLLTHKFYPDIGGIEVNSEILASRFLKDGHEVRVLTWTEAVGTKSFPFKIIRKPSLKHLLEEHKWAEVVFENNPCLRLAWTSFFFKKPSVVALRTWVSRQDGHIGWQDKVKFWWLKRASAVIAVSNAVRVKSWPEAVVIGNPYRHQLFRPSPQPGSRAGFVFLGRLVSDKGADLAIAGLHHLVKVKKLKSRSDEELTLTIIGEGPERKNLEEMVADLDLKDHVKFTGALREEKLVNCLNKHKFLLVPSLWDEPFGNVVLEGLACGCIPIVSNGGGLPDAVGNAGLVFQKGDLNSLLNCLCKVLENQELEKQLRSNAEAHLRTHHPKTVSRRYLEILESVVKPRLIL